MPRWSRGNQKVRVAGGNYQLVLFVPIRRRSARAEALDHAIDSDRYAAARLVQSVNKYRALIGTI